MDRGAYGLSTKPLVGLALMQCAVQGVLIQMLVTFLATKSNHTLWFKIYVVFINILTLGQTIIHIIQAFQVIDTVHADGALVAAAPVLTGLIGAAVQAFFIHRCWRIYRQRILPTLPLIFVWLVSLVSATVMGAYLAQSLGNTPDNVKPDLQVSTVIWVVSTLIFDLVTTTSTIIYLYRVRIGSNDSRSRLTTVWNVIWASAAPPLVLMIVTLVDHYIIASSSGVIGTLTMAMSAKFFVLSLLINLVGQEFIRKQFERPYPSPVVLHGSWSQTDRVNEPVGGITAHTVDIELQPSPTRVGTESQNGPGKDHSDDISIKCPSVAKQAGDVDHTIHNIQLNSNPTS